MLPARRTHQALPMRLLVIWSERRTPRKNTVALGDGANLRFSTQHATHPDAASAMGAQILLRLQSDRGIREIRLAMVLRYVYAGSRRGRKNVSRAGAV
jgi:hypothetical protein